MTKKEKELPESFPETLIDLFSIHCCYNKLSYQQFQIKVIDIF